MTTSQTSPKISPKISRHWCDCGHWTEARTDVFGYHGRCITCYTNCPAIGGCKNESVGR